MIWSPFANWGVFDQVDDLDLILLLEILFADVPKIGDRGQGLGGLTGDIEPQLVDRGFRRAIFTHYVQTSLFR